MTNAPFIRDMQVWVWKRFPSRQLSATDIYYVLQWSESGVPSSLLIDGFEHYLKTRTNAFETSGRLSELRFEAGRIIADYQKTLLAPSNVPPVTVDEPFEIALTRIAQAGQATDNPLLQSELRKYYKAMLDSKSKAQSAYPEYQTRIESFYAYKAQALLAWDKGLETLLTNCRQFLSAEETATLETLSPPEKLHCILLSEEAKTNYIKQIFQKKLADYFNLSTLLEPL
ncbi:MAG: hypothetical protein II767_04595 [Proteobacteria bacterium]|nr:hypothetical protein [Pseudomonadota bacterium]MBQ4359514.1 hypothetical protein [Pseudomonadota bacterium]